MSERDLCTQVERYLKTIPYLWYYKASDKWTSGIPDLIICYKGKFIGIELKTAKGKVSKIQEFVGKKICAAGCVFAVCRSLKEVKEVIYVK